MGIAFWILLKIAIRIQTPKQLIRWCLPTSFTLASKSTSFTSSSSSTSYASVSSGPLSHWVSTGPLPHRHLPHRTSSTSDLFRIDIGPLLKKAQWDHQQHGFCSFPDVEPTAQCVQDKRSWLLSITLDLQLLACTLTSKLGTSEKSAAIFLKEISDNSEPFKCF